MASLTTLADVQASTGRSGTPPKARSDSSGLRDSARVNLVTFCRASVVTSGLYSMLVRALSVATSVPENAPVRPGRPRPRMPLVMPSPFHAPRVARPICCLRAVMVETLMLGNVSGKAGRQALGSRMRRGDRGGLL